MPRLSEFFGIVIQMYWNEESQQIPHFRAVYGSEEASVGFDGTSLSGTLPTRPARLVRESALLHQSQLVRNWDSARERRPLENIEPLS